MIRHLTTVAHILIALFSRVHPGVSFEAITFISWILWLESHSIDLFGVLFNLFVWRGCLLGDVILKANRTWNRGASILGSIYFMTIILISREVSLIIVHSATCQIWLGIQPGISCILLPNTEAIICVSESARDFCIISRSLKMLWVQTGFLSDSYSSSYRWSTFTDGLLYLMRINISYLGYYAIAIFIV